MKKLVLAICLLVAAISGAAPQNLLPNAQQTFTGPNGTPLAGGFIFTYVPGTTTPKMTWQDPVLSVPNSNPIVLDANGQARIWAQGDYRQVVLDANSSLVWDQLTRTPDAGLSNGILVMYQVSPSFDCTVPFHIATPDGSVINTAGTTTSGLQEALDQGVRDKGWSLIVNSIGGAASAGYGIQACSPIIYPVLRRQAITFNGVGISCTPAVGVCETFDSCAEGGVYYRGSEHGGAPNPGTINTASVLFDPRTVLPFEGFIGITGCEYDLGSVFQNVQSGLSQATIRVSLAHGGIIGAIFRTAEINGAGPGGSAQTHYGFLIDSPQALTAWEGNELDLGGETHLFDAGGLQEGLNITHQSNFYGNKYFLASMKGNGSPTSAAISLFGRDDIVEAPHISNEEGSYGYGLVLNQGAAENVITANADGYSVAAFLDISNQPNNYTMKGKVVSQNFQGGQLSAIAVAAFDAGAGATLDTGATNYTGTVNVGGTNNQQTVTVSFSISYFLLPKCFADINQPAIHMQETSLGLTAVTWTARNSAGAATSMPTGARVSWQCQ